jgi:hypothetical protein
LAFNINLEGATAGVYFDSSYSEHGFLRSPAGGITSFDPTNSIGTMVCEETCLNSNGQITGFWVDQNFAVHGFLREPDGHITTFDAPSPTTIPTAFTIAASGCWVDANGVNHGFLWNPVSSDWFR